MIEASIIFLMLIVGGALILAAFLHRPDLTFSQDHLFLDSGTNLLLAQRLSEGAHLYRDLGYSYGPLAIMPYLLWSKAFGNTPQSFSALLGTISLINLALVYIVMRTRVSRETAVIVVLAGLLTTILIPGSLVYSYQTSGYSVLERTLFLLVLALWRPPSERTVKGAAVLGLVFGLWQLLRFGTALFLGFAIVLIDILALVLGRTGRPGLRHWLRISLITLAAFLAVECAWVTYAFATLPHADAFDAVWPSFVLAGFTVWPDYLREPHFISFKYFVAQQLTIVVSGLCAIAGTYLVIRRIRETRPAGSSVSGDMSGMRDLRLVIPLVFYAIGSLYLFRAASHFNQYAWMLPVSAALLLNATSWRVRVAFAAFMLPTVALNARIYFLNDRLPDMVRLALPNGSSLVVPEDVALRIQSLRDYAAGEGGRALFILPTGAGFHTMFDVPQPTRQSWQVLGFARAGDGAAMLRILATRPSAVVLTEHPEGERPGVDPCAWYEYSHFETAFCPVLARHLAISQAIRLDRKAWIIPSIADSIRAARRSRSTENPPVAPVSPPSRSSGT